MNLISKSLDEKFTLDDCIIPFNAVKDYSTDAVDQRNVQKTSGTNILLCSK